MTHDRRKRERRGRIAEGLAALWLCLKGYRITHKRYKTPVGEIDLIARRRGLTTFVEVKRRQSHEKAAFSVSHHQQSRIIRAARYFQAHSKQAMATDYRFDVILIAPGCWPKHIENAFQDGSGL